MGGEAVSAAKGNSGGGAKSGIVLDSRLLGVVAVAVLFIISLYLWTLPFQKNRLPFGEGDAAWHFAIGDHIASSDKADFRLPYYVGVWYFGYNRILGAFAPEYPPPNHVNYALMQIFGGERFVPLMIYRAFASFLGVFAVFFLVSRLFGVLSGFLAGLGLSFSIREQLTSLFGQQPALTSLVITPVTTYAWYAYLASFYDAHAAGGINAGSSQDGQRGGRKIYLYLAFALLASQFLLHMQGFVASSVIMAVFTIAMAVKFRKLPVSRSNIKAFAVAAIMLAIVAAPFLAIYFGTPDTQGTGFSFSLPRLLQWGISPESVQGSFPAAFVQFSAEYGKFLLPFLFAGIALLILRLFLVRNNSRELFLLSWLIGTYIILHLDVFTGASVPRLARMLVIENYAFFSLIALSVVWIPQTISSILKLDAWLASAAKYSLAAVLLFVLLSNGWGQTSDRLKAAYGGLERITPIQAEFASGFLAKLPEKAFVYDPVLPSVGGFPYTTWRYAKMRWMLAISQRYVGRDVPEKSLNRVADRNEVYELFDYSDLAVMASSSDEGTKQLGMALGSELRKIEVQMFNNTTPLYDNNNIRLYRYPMPVENSSALEAAT
ncbi:hypothetical protein HYY73_06275 [Candidatus Woesearchaeota archaeon]|nr:hypothetical protein [Candidatus Woesearchaeota archaeon]